MDTDSKYVAWNRFTGEVLASSDDLVSIAEMSSTSVAVADRAWFEKYAGKELEGYL